MRRVEFTSPFARAVLPIIGGIAGFALLFGITWILASTSTKNRENQIDTVPQTFEIGQVKDVAKSIDDGGPILYPDLRDATGKRSIVIDHTGSDPAKGWQVYYAYPADRNEACLVTDRQVLPSWQAAEMRDPRTTSALFVRNVLPPAGP